MTRKVIIMGAAGRDFHNFNVYYRDNEDFKVIAFTAAQIPNIENRIYPPELAGKLYPNGIPIYSEEKLTELIKKHDVDEVVFSYSDVSHEYVMHKASEILAAGASFRILGPKDTMLESSKPVVSVCAARTGSGKSPLSRWIVSKLRCKGFRVVVVRHPMPYGDLKKQIVERFEKMSDLDEYKCTIEEREDYEPHLERGAIVYSGVDFERVLEEAEREADVIVWDGGNNDFPFVKPNLHIVVIDPHRAGHELMYHPGETNVRMADVIVISKANTARPEDVRTVEENARRLNSKAQILKANMTINLESDIDLRDKKVLVVEDGPTLTHGGMSYGAATLKCLELGALIVDPRPYAKRSVKKVFKEYPHLGKVLPAMGYGVEQMRELEETINETPCDYVVSGTPTDLSRFLRVNKPVLRVRYEIGEIVEGELEKAIIERILKLLQR